MEPLGSAVETKAMLIARRLYLFNIIPAFVAVIVMCCWIAEYPRYTPDFRGKCYFGLLVLGIACEFFYYLQAKNERFANNKSMWVYSIVLNVVFIGFEADKFVGVKYNGDISTDPACAMLIIYPATFLFFSCKALYHAYRA